MKYIPSVLISALIIAPLAALAAAPSASNPTQCPDPANLQNVSPYWQKDSSNPIAGHTWTFKVARLVRVASSEKKEVEITPSSYTGVMVCHYRSKVTRSSPVQSNVKFLHLTPVKYTFKNSAKWVSNPGAAGGYMCTDSVGDCGWLPS